MRRIMFGTAVAMAISAVGTPARAMEPATTANLSTAMHDEATAYADYMAWADHAANAGNTELATLLSATADQERDEHFAELADAAVLVRSAASNIRTMLFTTADLASTTYPAYAAQADADGDAVTSALFSAMADDEAADKDLLRQAYWRLNHIAVVPVPPVVDPVAIVEGAALASGQTLANVRVAMRTEAYLSAQYRLYADAAYMIGNAWLGNLFVGLSNVAIYVHYAALANRYGLVGSVASNLEAAIVAENAAITSYAAWSTAAANDDDLNEAALFDEIGADEVMHRDAFVAMVE